MEQERHEETRSPRERLARMRTLVRRGLMYWKGSLLMFSLAGLVAVACAWRVQHVYRSECTVFAKARIRTDDRDDSSTSPDQVARQAARLKDMLTTRPRLESAIKKFALYRETTANKTMLDAVEQMKPHVGFRALEGAQYVISFDGDDPDVVQKVTQYLSESLTTEYAAGDLDDLQQEADFLADEERRSLAGLEESTKALTLFLAAHPEFAVEAKQAASTPFGPSPVAGIPLMPKVPGAAAAADPELGALYRQHARLDGEARSAANTARGVVAGVASSKQIDDQIVQAQAEVEVAAKRVAETLTDLASKSNLTEDHPDMRAARIAVDVGARQLHGARGKLAALQQIKEGARVDPSQISPEIAEKLRQIDLQITMRRAHGARTRPSSGAESPEQPATLATAGAVTAVVELETDWQRLLRALSEFKSHHDDLNLRCERAKLALEASRAQANERMAVVDPPFRPTHPVKGGRTNVAIAGLAMACLLAVAYVTARVSLDDTLVDVDDLEALGLAPVLGVVPALDLDPPRKKVREHAAA
jgi:hypothetical protein